jgi:hypothetical protein
MIIDKGVEKTAVKTNIAVYGEMYSKEKIDDLITKKRNRELDNNDPDYYFLNKIKDLNLEQEDYIFQVITTRRKRNFLVDGDINIILEVFPNETIKVMS